MSSDNKEQDSKGINRRDLMKMGAIAGAGVIAAGSGIQTAWAEPKAPPSDGKLKTNSKTGVRTIVITDAQLNIRAIPGARICQAQLQPGDRRCQEGAA